MIFNRGWTAAEKLVKMGSMVNACVLRVEIHSRKWLACSVVFGDSEVSSSKLA